LVKQNLYEKVFDEDKIDKPKDEDKIDEPKDEDKDNLE
jgi:hypothetical protein